MAGMPDNRLLMRGRSPVRAHANDAINKAHDGDDADSLDNSPHSSRVSFEQPQRSAGSFGDRGSSRHTSGVKTDAPLKKKSWMNWKPLRAIAQIGTSKSSCVFSLTLHYIENLPSNYNGRRVAVNWLRKENYVDSKPATVSEGSADFEEILHLKCTMYGGKGGTKYLPKSSTLSVCAIDGDRAVLGRHKLDLSRLLPNGDAPGRRGSQGGLDGSTVSFPLTIGTLTVTFGYKVADTPDLNQTWTSSEMTAPRTGGQVFAVSRSMKLLQYEAPSPKTAPVHPEPIEEHPKVETRESGTSPEAAAAAEAAVRDSGTSPERAPVGTEAGGKDSGTSPEAQAAEEKILEGEGGAEVENGSEREAEGKKEGEEEVGAVEVVDLEEITGEGEKTGEEGPAVEGEGEQDENEVQETTANQDEKASDGPDEDEAEFLQLLGTKSGATEFQEAEDTDFDARSDVAQMSQPSSPKGSLLPGFEGEGQSDHNDSQPPTPKTALLRQFEAEGGAGLFAKGEGNLFGDLVDDDGVAYAADKEGYNSHNLEGGEYGYDGVVGEGGGDKAGYRLVHRPRYVIDDNGQWVIGGYEEEYELIEEGEEGLYSDPSNQDFGRTDYELYDDRPMTGEELWEAYKSQEGFHAALRRRNGDMEEVEESYPMLSEEYLAAIEPAPKVKTTKSRVEELEAAETEMLMQQFGLTQDAFDDSPTPPQNPMARHLSRVASAQADAMSLAHAAGNQLAPPSATALNSGGPSVVALGDGGCLRAMDMRLFPKGSSGLVMQCSQPVVVPPEMGGSAVEIMQRMAGAGADGMIAGALASMPMAELTGMSIDQIAAEGMAALEGSNKKGWASLLDTGLGHNHSVKYTGQSLEGGQSPLGLEGGQAPLALEYQGSSQQTGQLATAGRPGFSGYSSNFAELEADRKALAVFEGNLPESLSEEARALAIRDVKTELAMRRESRARRQARDLAARGQGGVVGGDRPLAPGELPEQLVGLEELGPLAMQTVESLAIEGLKIQTDMTDQDAPYQVDALSWGDVDPKFIEQAKKQAQAGQLPMMGGPQQFQMLEGGEYVATSSGSGAMVPMGAFDFSGRNNDMELSAEDYEAYEQTQAIMASAVSLDEWMRLDTGVSADDEEGMSEQTRAILAAHRAAHGDIAAARARSGGPQPGMMGDKLTLAMLVQLRDPLRNYEPVGQPMLAMVQAERVLQQAPQRRTKRQARLEAKQHMLQLEGGQNKQVTEGGQKRIMGPEEERGEEEEESAPQGTADGAVQDEEDVFYSDDDELEDAPPPPVDSKPQFRITGVHMAGLGKNDQPDAAASKHKKWGGQKQQVAGSRWLLANGLGHSAKSNMMKGKALPAKTRVKKGETLWSISSRVYGDGSKWKDVAALNPHIRNPDVIFADDTIRMR